MTSTTNPASGGGQLGYASYLQPQSTGSSGGGLGYANYLQPQGTYNPSENPQTNPSTGVTSAGTNPLPSGTSTTTPTASGASGGSGGLLSGLSSLLGSNAGQLGLYSGLYELISSQASNAQNENNALAGQITDIGAPAVGESQSLLGAYSGGTLTSPFQQQLNAALNANQNTANTETQQASQLLANSGGGQNISGALSSQTQQIQNALTQANTAAVSNAFTSELSSSDSLLTAGGPYVQAGVAQEIQSNTQLQQQLSSLMASLASAYAQSTSGSSTAAAAPKATTPSASGGGGSGGGGTKGSGSGAGSGGSGTGDSSTLGYAPYNTSGLNNAPYNTSGLKYQSYNTSGLNYASYAPREEPPGNFYSGGGGYY